MKKKLILPKKVPDADLIFERFVKRHVRRHKRAITPREDLTEAYVAFCAELGVEPLQGQALRHRYTRMGINSFGNGVRLVNVARE